MPWPAGIHRCPSPPTCPHTPASYPLTPTPHTLSHIQCLLLLGARRIKPGMGTKRQKKKTQKFEDKLQKWKDLKACKMLFFKRNFLVSLEGSAWFDVPSLSSIVSLFCSGPCGCSKETEP